MVTYNPEPSLADNVQAVLQQVARLIIVDNQSLPAAQALIAQVCCLGEVEVIWSKQNQGIAGGLNSGIRRALETGQYAWIATVDQDTLVPPDHLEKLLGSFSACRFRDQIAMVGATYASVGVDVQPPTVTARAFLECREVETLMTSGSLLRTSAFAVTGLFDSSLFMDCVDHEFCLRLRKYGFKVMQAKAALLAHQPGSPTSHQILWKKITTTNHSPSRRYHNAHNRVLVYRRYAASEPRWAARDIYDWIRDAIKVGLVEDHRKEKFLGIAKGAWAALWKPLPAPDSVVDRARK